MRCPICQVGELYTVQNSKDSSDMSLFKPVNWNCDFCGAKYGGKYA